MERRSVPDDAAGAPVPEDVDLDQIVERLGWTPAERLRYLLDMLEFEELAHTARQRDEPR